MINIFKNRNINKNPFVKFLKDFFKTENDSVLKELSGTEGIIEHYLGNGRTVVFNNGSLMLVNDNYSSLGYLEVPIEDMTYKTGNIYFIVEAEDVKANMIQIFFSSLKQVYKLINEIDSNENESELKNLFVRLEGLGLLTEKKV